MTQERGSEIRGQDITMGDMETPPQRRTAENDVQDRGRATVLHRRRVLSAECMYVLHKGLESSQRRLLLAIHVHLLLGPSTFERSSGAIPPHAASEQAGITMSAATAVGAGYYRV